MAYIMGGVFSHKAGFTSLGELAFPLGFHAVCMALGLFLLSSRGWLQTKNSETENE